MIKGRPAYKNLRHFIYIHAHPQSRGEGYRLVKKFIEETREDCAKVIESEAEATRDYNINQRLIKIAAAIRGRG